MSTTYEFFQAGRWRRGDDWQEVTSPFDDTAVGRVARADPAAASAATLAAVHALETVGRRASSRERAGWLEGVRDRVQARTDEIARTMVREMGKPIKFARLELERCLHTLRDGAEEARRLRGEYLPLDVVEASEGYWGVVRRVPVGAVLAIVPFNFPSNLLAHKLAPGLAAGCPMVIKPSPRAPLTALEMARAVDEAGVPEGMVSVLPCSDEVAGKMVEDERFGLLSFTGSARVGWMLKSRAGKKRVHLELGNDSAVVVHDDCPDPEWTARRCAAGGFGAAGQSCISVQRIFVHERLFDDFVARLANAATDLVQGDPMDDRTDVGPLVDREAADRVMEWIDEAVSGGARVVCGGRRHGAMVAPTVLTEVPDDARVQREEVFGPVVTVRPYDDFADALAAVNSTPLGLQAGIFTRDIGRIRRAWDDLAVGGVVVNDYPTFRVDNMPYGGVGDSGLGREGVRYALDDYTERRLLVVNGDATR